jgi:hypothetical protein
MYYFIRLSHIVDEFILRAGMLVWVVCTHTRLPNGYMMLPIYVPAGRHIIPYPSPYRVKPVGYSGFGYPLPSLIITCYSAMVSIIRKKYGFHQNKWIMVWTLIDSVNQWCRRTYLWTNNMDWITPYILTTMKRNVFLD